MSSYIPASKALYSTSLDNIPLNSLTQKRERKIWVFIAAVFLVSVPVFVQAPLVRLLPWLSLAMTGGWLGLSLWLRSRPRTAVWGDLMMGFTWTWLTGAVYWGWLRWEPFLHLPVEAIGLPFVLLGLTKQEGKIGNWFYLGSLLGTAMTDLYFYLVNLMPHWRQLMQIEPDLAQLVFQSAAAQVQTPWGIGCAVVLVTTLLMVGCLPLRFQQLHWWTFSGSVLSTLLVDGLFWLAATTA